MDRMILLLLWTGLLTSKYLIEMMLQHAAAAIDTTVR